MGGLFIQLWGENDNIKFLGGCMLLPYIIEAHCLGIVIPLWSQSFANPIFYSTLILLLLAILIIITLF